MSVAIVDYGSGNLRSASKAFERVLRDLGRGDKVLVTPDPGRVAAADRVVLPGVGAFGHCRSGLDAIAGMVDALEEAVHHRGVPFLGICVGMQLMAERGFEHGEHEGLGWIAGEVVEMAGAGLRVPHMGWNELAIAAGGHPVLAGIASGSHAYFVHGYQLRCARREDVLSETEYGGPVAAVVGNGNTVGTQFHPEKSQALGLRLIGNFLQWNP